AVAAIAMGALVWAQRMYDRRVERLARALRYAQLAQNDSDFSGYHAARATVLELSLRNNLDEAKADAIRNAVAESANTARRYGRNVSPYPELERRPQHAADHPWESVPRELLAGP